MTGILHLGGPIIVYGNPHVRISEENTPSGFRIVSIGMDEDERTDILVSEDFLIKLAKQITYTIGEEHE